MVMEHYGNILQAFQVGPTELEPWDYDPGGVPKCRLMFWVMLEIAPLIFIQAPCKLLGTRAQTYDEQIVMMRKVVSATCHPGTVAFPPVLVQVPRCK